MQRSTSHLVTRALGALTLAGLISLAAACSDDDSGVTARPSGDGTTASVAPGDDPDATTAGSADDAPDSTSAPNSTSAPEPTDAGDDPSITIPDDLTDLSLPDDFSDISIPDVNEECLDQYTDFSNIFTSILAGGQTSDAEVDAAIDELRSELPDDLQDEVDVIADVYEGFAEILEEHGGDITQLFTDPAATEQLAELNSAEVSEALDAISAYFAETCTVEE